ncbi:pyruvate dehydrogenase (acetyl-transferring) E1 component subunit alpha [Serinibacter arcticus]|uniref:Pyruvate dehydrogenase (Acetyl-transferring) E1 component subunit alpha n=1 Tax=Serinibacter arcticus TaxID=1655435 RepID=A0A2U1ZZT4_9MICO|nr:pyruvate dehydrogenase (acetyl-transferring) E1 component subunit alpha [Serinibacter arcticus]
MSWPDPCEIAGTVRLVAPDGSRLSEDAVALSGHAVYAAAAARTTPDELRAMYRDMVLVRAFDREATSLQRQGELGLWPECRGQEAAQIGSAHALRPRDHVFPSYREHGVAHVRGLDLREILHLFRGTEHGGWDPTAHGFHIYTLVIGSHTLHATGYAMGIQRDGDVGTGTDRDRAVVAYFGDGATAQGDVNEALVFAATTNAPVVFFCQNNHWAISAPTTVQTTVPLVERGAGFGVPSIRVDGNDVVAVKAVTEAALERARSGGGPTFIEAVTYRMGAHTTSDDPTRYRERAEEDAWSQRDPIERLGALLRAEGLVDDAFFAGIDADATELTAGVRAYCRSLTPPPAESMFDHVYAAQHTLVDEERAWYGQYASSFEQAAAGS